MFEAQRETDRNKEQRVSGKPEELTLEHIRMGVENALLEVIWKDTYLA